VRALARTARTSTERACRAVRLAETAVASAAFDRAATGLRDLELMSLAPALLDRALPLLVAVLTAEGGDEAAERALAALAALAGGDPLRRVMIDVWRVSDREPAPARAQRARRASELLTGRQDLPRAQHRALALLLVARLDAGHGLDPVVLGRMRALEADLPMLPLVDTADAAVGLYGYQVGELAASRAQLEVLAARAERSGETPVAGLFRVHLAVVELLGGQQAKAAALLPRLDGTGPGAPGPHPATVRAKASLALVRGDEAALDAALAPSGALETLPGQITRLALRGAWATAHERWAEAVPVLSEALDLAAEHGCHEPGRRLWADTMLGPGLVALGRLEGAGQVAGHLESAASRSGRSLLGGHALRLRGLLSAASGDLELAQEQLRQAADVIAEGQVPADHARCLLDLGRVLRRRRARTECRRVLHEVLAIAQRTGDRPLLALVERELTGSGRTAAPDALTASEQRVAVAAAGGLRNREIAAACFVSVRTVETQLSAVYRKLGVRSRVQLAARLRVEASA
jgi:DNA-binding CsgD family transcriptional regulator